MSKNKNKDSLDLAQEYLIAFQSPNPKSFEQIPDIIDYLTYIDEESNKEGRTIYTRKRLSPIAKELYRILVRAAGNTVGWKNRETLAWELNCSTGAITNAKKELSQSFEQLDGKSLIQIERRMIPTKKNGVVINKKPNDVISINFIWSYNNGFMAIFDKEKYCKDFPCIELKEKEAEIEIEKMRQLSDQNVYNLEASSHYDRAYKASSYYDRAHQGASSYYDINHTLYSHTPINKSYPPAKPGSDKFEKLNESMNDLGIYRSYQDKLVDKYNKDMLYDVIQHFYQLPEKVKRNIPKEKRGSYVIKMLEKATGIKRP